MFETERALTEMAEHQERLKECGTQFVLLYQQLREGVDVRNRFEEWKTRFDALTAEGEELAKKHHDALENSKRHPQGPA